MSVFSSYVFLLICSGLAYSLVPIPTVCSFAERLFPRFSSALWNDFPYVLPSAYVSASRVKDPLARRPPALRTGRVTALTYELGTNSGDITAGLRPFSFFFSGHSLVLIGMVLHSGDAGVAEGDMAATDSPFTPPPLATMGGAPYTTGS